VEDAVREIKKRDESRQADITILFNQDDEIIGIRIEPFKPIPIIDFNLDRLLRPQMIMRPQGFPPMPTMKAPSGFGS
jgi:hypothetical protein